MCFHSVPLFPAWALPSIYTSSGLQLFLVAKFCTCALPLQVVRIAFVLLFTCHCFLHTGPCAWR